MLYELPGADDVALREHIEQLSRQTGKTPEALGLVSGAAGAGVEISADMEGMWRRFWELERGRTGNGFGRNPLSWPDIDAWARLTGERPTPWQIAALRDMDRACLDALARKERQKHPGER